MAFRYWCYEGCYEVLALQGVLHGATQGTLRAANVPRGQRCLLRGFGAGSISLTFWERQNQAS